MYKRIGLAIYKNNNGLKNTRKHYLHASAKRESLLIVGGVALAGSAIAVNYGIQAWTAYQARPKSERAMFAKNFYDGPFEDTMTRREAALILGVRERATEERIRAAHKRLLVINHPDTGGSTLIATKLNEAKDILLSGKE